MPSIWLYCAMMIMQSYVLYPQMWRSIFQWIKLKVGR